MKDGVCSKCKSEEVYLSSRETHGVRVPISWMDVFTDLYVCASCGYLEFYVESKTDLEKVPQKLKKVKK